MKNLDLDDLPNIKPEFFDTNWCIPEQDVFLTNLFKEGHYKGEPHILKAILYLMGMDVHRNWEATLLESGASIRSEITGNLQLGGVVYRGYLRNDPNWSKEGLNITQKYLFGDCGWIKNLLGKE